ncbi:MAG: glycosyltransferase, partial [Burkholderiales bacterium]
MKRILMVAYHFPPLAGSSGIQRTLRFVQHLPALGWEPLVLSADPRAYERTSDDLQKEVPPNTVVRRAFALDTARHLTIGGRYLGPMARPDRFVSWKFAGVREGMRMIREFKPDAIWSTYPIATAHLIAAELQRKSGLPWIADFRDPMAQDGYPADPKTWQSFKRIEEQALTQARRCVFTTPGAARMYRERYPEAAPRIVVLENGYDEESFLQAQAALPVPDDSVRAMNRPVVLLHSGIVYPSERDPTQLFVALSRLVRSGTLSADDLLIRFRASVHDDLLRRLAAEHGVSELIELCP